jgi:phage baseplate assembly protein W
MPPLDRKALETLGRDLRLNYAWSGGYFEDADLAGGVPEGKPPGELDLMVVDGVDNLTQAVANRLKTRRGELTALGHAGYGSRHHEMLGEPDVARTRNLIKLFVLQALRDEPRIERVLSVAVEPADPRQRDVVRIRIAVKAIRSETPLNLVVPFSLEVS